MNWRFPLALDAPVAALPRSQSQWEAWLYPGQPLFTLGPPSPEPWLRGIGDRVGDPAMALRWGGSPRWSRRPPKPWAGCLADEPPDEAEVRKIHIAEVALALNVLPRHVYASRRVLSPNEVFRRLQQGGELEARHRQAFAFALFDPNGPLDTACEPIQQWQTAMRGVLHQRRDLERSLKPRSLLLAMGFRLLEQISRLRLLRPSLEDLEAGWRTLEQQWAAACREWDQPHLAEAPPLAFALVFWGEAVYRQAELGETARAGELLERQSGVARELIALLPHLEPSLEGGMWRHHVGRLAYYRGDFPQALNHYVQEWRLAGSLMSGSLGARLRRSLSSVCSDLGLLTAALDQAEASLSLQEAGDEPEDFKTLGRLGEIHVRRGDLNQARDFYRRSWDRQQDRERDGRSAVYLGHVCLLQGQLPEAWAWYETAEKADRSQGVHFNPYGVMGRMAWALRCGDRSLLWRLWRRHERAFSRLENEQVLAAAMAATAVALTPPPSGWRERLGVWFERTLGWQWDEAPSSEHQVEALLTLYSDRLVQENFLVEALYPLSRLYPSPAPAADRLTIIRDGLRAWDMAVREVGRSLPLLSADAEPLAPGSVADALAQALAADDWSPLAPIFERVFPVNLLVCS